MKDDSRCCLGSTDDVPTNSTLKVFMQGILGIPVIDSPDCGWSGFPWGQLKSLSSSPASQLTHVHQNSLSHQQAESQLLVSDDPPRPSSLEILLVPLLKCMNGGQSALALIRSAVIPRVAYADLRQCSLTVSVKPTKGGSRWA
ncbi:hypothetical protein L249_2370 [Ophiocordyceps polyrhachis-furcata BCC 54312]|uniref:Uncharacterized protein n=1 Tax=Ophiocordyceps polyrhachis-furcata BCC 54312 TaxID=1330021 RepID=A0A367LP52_9HYPO|nr:hypothetical protein L249_2370 [Ophiocordyceps polyrhachis-furcata BCC 54312]